MPVNPGKGGVAYVRVDPSKGGVTYAPVDPVEEV